MAPIEPVVDGSAVICGACGALHVVDVAVAEWLASRPLEVFLRQPTRAEALALRSVPEVAEALSAFERARLEDWLGEAAKMRRSAKVKMRRLPTETIRGPDA